MPLGKLYMKPREEPQPEENHDEMAKSRTVLEDDWLTADNLGRRNLGYRWTGMSAFQKVDGSWQTVRHKKPRWALATPALMADKEALTGKRWTWVVPWSEADESAGPRVAHWQLG